ncbi:MAG TPA: response regulator transcription factor [Paludibaculum sp.]|jgi:two-component system alkaline phosphatase synthesis response regulator PhoP
MPIPDARRILLAEDDPALTAVLTDLLEAEFHHVTTASDGTATQQRAAAEKFDLIVLDIMLPDQTGFEVCRSIRQQGIEVPVLMLSARSTLADRVQGLMLGADDYLTKPFHPAELIARVHALLRRARKTTPGRGNTERFGEILVDFARGRVERNGQTVNLATKEMELLKYLADRPDRVVTREELLAEVWGYHTSNTRTLDVHMAQLRQKLERNPSSPQLLLTVRGQGYQLCAGQQNGA